MIWNWFVFGCVTGTAILKALKNNSIRCLQSLQSGGMEGPWAAEVSMMLYQALPPQTPTSGRWHASSSPKPIVGLLGHGTLSSIFACP